MWTTEIDLILFIDKQHTLGNAKIKISNNQSFNCFGAIEIPTSIYEEVTERIYTWNRKHTQHRSWKHRVPN